ncbi:MAG: LamG domain-containing protein [Pirellulales bacterium]|nr:LamG domain-containing protein [Pirellulales bacterium]
MKVRTWKSFVAMGSVAAAFGLGVMCQSALAVPLYDGLISYWPLSEKSGGIASDAAPGGSVDDNGTLRNSPAWINGKFNAGLQFNGVDQDVLIPASADMDINTNGVTLSAWVKLDQLPAEITGSFAGIFDSAPDNYVMYLDKGNNELRFKATNASGVSTVSAQHPGIRASLLNTTDWIHVMGVYDGDAGRAKIYFNGQLADLTSQVSGANLYEGPVRAGQIAGIGAQPAATDPFAPTNLFKGSIADVAVWNRALGGAEAQYLYNGGAGNPVGAGNPNLPPLPPIAPVLPTAQPVIYYKFDGNLTNSGTGGGSLDAVLQGTQPVQYATTNYGSGLDLSQNPLGTASTTGEGDYLSVGYTLTDNGTIAARFTAVQLQNFVTLWSNSSHENDWESWIYGDGRIAARADRATPIVAENIFMLDDPTASNHYAFTWQRTGADVLVRLYVNGEFVDERLGAWRDPGDTFFIAGGVAGAGSNNYGTGVYDEFRVYDAALSEAEVLYLSQNAPPVVQPSFAADFNSDGSVNSDDLGLWKSGFGMASGAGRIDGNADGDGDVDGADFLIWQRQFGSGPTAAAVPEPASAALACLGLAAAIAGRAAQRRKSPAA